MYISAQIIYDVKAQYIDKPDFKSVVCLYGWLDLFIDKTSHYINIFPNEAAYIEWQKPVADSKSEPHTIFY